MNPSPAMIIACLALFIALTGAGTAAVAAKHYIITKKSQIKPSVYKKLKGKKGARGPAGANGATSVVKRVAEGSWDAYYSSATAYCNSGEVATGGGADWDNNTTSGWPLVSYSVPYPYNTTTPPTGWQVEIDNVGGFGGVQAIAWVICASP
jgi:hypothetical protein